MAALFEYAAAPIVTGTRVFTVIPSTFGQQYTITGGLDYGTLGRILQAYGT